MRSVVRRSVPLCGLPALAALLCLAAFAGPSLAQTADELAGIRGENRFAIVSQSVLFDLRALPSARIQVELGIDVKRETALLVFPLPAGRVESARLGEKEAETLAEGASLGIRLPAPAAPGARLALTLRTSVELAAEDIEDLFTLDDPRFGLPLDFAGERPVKAVFKTPDGAVVLGNGGFEGERAADGGRESSWTVLPGPRRTFFLRVQGRLFRSTSKGVEFLLACPAADDAAIRAVQDLLADVYFFLEELYGPRASRRLAAALTPAADKMGTRFNAGGLLCLQTGDLQNPGDPWLAGCLAHELSHEWWGGVLFGSKEDRQVLTECMAELSSIHYQEKRGGADRAQEDVVVNTVAYLEGDRKAVAETEDDLYSKSILMYRHLLHAVGEKAFFEAARVILQANAGKQVSHRMFFDAAGKTAGNDVQWLLDWLCRTDADLDFAVAELGFEQKDGAWTTRIRFAELVGRFDYPLEVPVRIETADGEARDLRVPIRRGSPVLEIVTRAPVKSVSVDPAWMLWDVDRSNNFFGTHAVSSKPSPRDPAIVAELAGGFRSRYRDRLMASLWVRSGAWATLVPFGGERMETSPLYAWAEDGKTLFVAFPGETQRGLQVDLSAGFPRILPLVLDGPRGDAGRRAMAEDLKAAEAAALGRVEETARRWAEGGAEAAARDMERVARDEANLKGGMGRMHMVAAFLYLGEPRPPRAREAAFDLLMSIDCRNEFEDLLRKNLKILIAGLDDDSPSVRNNAAYLLRGCPSPEAVEPLCRALFRDPEGVNGQAIFALQATGDPRAVPALVKVLETGYLWDRRNAAAALAHIPDPRAVEPLILALEREDPSKYSETEKHGMIPESPDPARRAFVEALEAITGRSFGIDPKAWRAWWETEGKKGGK